MDYSFCDSVTVDGDGECITHIDSLLYDKNAYGVLGLTFSTNQGNTDHVNQYSNSIEYMRRIYKEFNYTLDADTVGNQ